MKINRFNENINENEPEKGDYILCNINIDVPIFNFINNTISKLYDKYIWNNLQRVYIIQYDNVPNDIKDQFSKHNRNDKSFYTFDIAKCAIKNWSKNKEELEMILKSNKFNI